MLLKPAQIGFRVCQGLRVEAFKGLEGHACGALRCSVSGLRVEDGPP